MSHYIARLSHAFLESKFHFPATTLTGAAGNLKVVIFSPQVSNNSQFLLQWEFNLHCPRNSRIQL